MMKRKKRRILAISLIALGVALLAAGGILFYNWRNTTYILVNGTSVERSCETLELRGQQSPDLAAISQLKQLKTLDISDTGITEAEYLQLKNTLPDCTIRWSVPFQGQFIPSDTSQLTITSLAAEDINMFVYFTSLNAVDALAVTEQDILLTLRQQYPELRVMYDVHIGKEDYDHAKQILALADVDAESFTRALPHMQQLEKVAFTGKLPEMQQLIQWKKDYPNVTFFWDFEVFGKSVNSQTTKLILNDIPISSIEEVAQIMDCFYNMELVEMCHCGIPSEEMAKLRERFPNTKFVWIVKLGWAEFRTDITTFMPFKLGYSHFSDQHAKELKYCTDIICMDLGHQNIRDLSFLNYMPNMQYLLLCEIPARDFTPLKNLKNLRYLELFITEFRDTSLLSEMEHLEDLNICYTQVDDITPILKLKNIQHLWMNYTPRINAEERQQLHDTFPNAVIRYGHSGSTEGAWRKTPNYYAQRDLLEMNYMVG